MHARLEIADVVRFGAGGSSSGGSSPASTSGTSSDSDGSTTTSTDEYCLDDPREFRRHVSLFSSSDEVKPNSFSSISPSSSCALADVDKHLQRMVTLGSAPLKLLVALDMYDAVSEVFPGFARMFSSGPSHPVSVSSDTALAGLVDASRRCVRELRPSICAHYPWGMPQGGEVHPCVGFWMGYFRCMLRNRVSLFFILADDQPEPGAPFAPAGEGGLVAELISCLEAVLEEKSGALAFPGLRQVFMWNNTSAIVRRTVRSDLAMFLPPGWVRACEERMEGYVKGYLEASWVPVVARLEGGGATKPAVVWWSHVSSDTPIVHLSSPRWQNTHTRTNFWGPI